MDRMITPEQLAIRWSKSPGYLANLRSQGRGCSFVKLGRSVMYRLADVEKYEADCLTVTEFVKPKRKLN